MAELTASLGKANGKYRRSPKLLTRVDLTAMVDLAFLLITFFILTTTLQKDKMFTVAMPDKSEPAPSDGWVSEKRTMTICLGKNGQMVSYLGLTDKPITTPQVTGFTKDGIRKQIIELSKQVKAATGKNMIVLVKPSDHSLYENMVGALDELHITGVETYAIEDITPKETALLKQKGVY